MELKEDFESRQRDQRLKKALWLRCRWQEVKERERRAQLHNRKLLQDFQRAQDTLTDLVARTEAMNTVRVEYERYVQENFPRWQQSLKDKRLSEQRKRIKEHVKASMQKMEEEQKIDMGKSSAESSSPVSAPDLVPPFASQSVSHTSDHKDISREDNNQHIQGNIQNGLHPHSLFAWLSQNASTESQHDSISTETNILQNTRQAWNSPLLPHYQLSGDSFNGSYFINQQRPNFTDYMWQDPKSRSGRSRDFTPRAQSVPADAAWLGFPFINPLVWGMMGTSELDAEGMQGSKDSEEEKGTREGSRPQVDKHSAKKQRKMKRRDQSSELDLKSVHFQNVHGDNGALSSDVVRELAAKVEKRRSEMRRKMVFQESSSTSDSQSDTNNKNNSNQNSSKRVTSFKTCKASKAQVKSTAPVDSPKHRMDESDEKGNRVQEKLTNVFSALQKDRIKDERQESDEEEEEEHQKHSFADGRVNKAVKNGLNLEEDEEEEGANQESEEQDEEGSEGLNEEGNGTGPSDGGRAEGGMEEKVEEEALGNNAAESVSEKEPVTEEEEEEMREHIGNRYKEEEEDEGSDSGGSDDEGSDSGRNVHDSIKELYQDDTEDEELYNQEIEDDTEDDDDDDEVIETALPTSSSAYNHSKYQEDEYDEDVEGLLAPQNNSHQLRTDEPEESVKPPVLHSDSEEESLHRKLCSVPVLDEQVNSDDEFDHFYD